MKDPMALRHLMDEVFVQEYLYIIETTVLLSLCDLSMLQFLPWKKSRFFTLSEGYPSMGFMKICLVIKTVQSIMTAVSEIIFLTKYNAIGVLTNKGAQALVYLNIIFGVFNVVFSLLVLCMRGEILSNMQNETAMSARAELKSMFDGFSGKVTPRLKRPSAIVETESVYHDNTDYMESHMSSSSSSSDGGDIAMMSNPLHATSSSSSSSWSGERASASVLGGPFLHSEEAEVTLAGIYSDQPMPIPMEFQDVHDGNGNGNGGGGGGGMVVNPMLNLNMTMASITTKTKDSNNDPTRSTAKPPPSRLTEIEEAALADTTTASAADAVGNEEKNATEIDKSTPALPDFEL
jgi:hypothetical protein